MCVALLFIFLPFLPGTTILSHRSPQFHITATAPAHSLQKHFTFPAYLQPFLIQLIRCFCIRIQPFYQRPYGLIVFCFILLFPHQTFFADAVGILFSGHTLFPLQLLGLQQKFPIIFTEIKRFHTIIHDTWLRIGAATYSSLSIKLTKTRITFYGFHYRSPS